MESMESLLKKYAGGRIPPLVTLGDEPENEGLLNGDLVSIYQQGFSGRYSIPLGILAAGKVWYPIKNKWENADYRLNEYAKEDWTSFCKKVRNIDEANEKCESCDRVFAIKAEQEGKVIAYICCHGMIDFAIPIFLDGIVIAVALSGQRKPKPETLWNPEILKEEGIYQLLIKKEEGKDGKDIWTYCTNIINGIKTKYGIESDLISLLNDDVSHYPGIEVSPDDINRIMEQLDKASNHLSKLVTTAFHLEKSKVVAWIRSEIAKSLKSLTEEEPNVENFWNSVSDALLLTSQYFGCDYTAVISCQKDPKPILKVLACSERGVYPDGFCVQKINQDISVPENQISRLIETTDSVRIETDIDTSLFAPALKCVIPPNVKSITRAIVMPAGLQNTNTTFIIMGNNEKNFVFEKLAKIDQESLNGILDVLSMIIEVALLVSELQLATRRQTNLVDELQTLAKRQADFILDVSHDIRNPIQNIIIKAERLRRGLVDAKDISYHVHRVAVQCKRLHLISERVWTLEALDREKLDIEKGVRLKVYDVLSECIDSLFDLASAQRIEIKINPNLQRWRPLDLDKRFFTQAILNLLDNAVKYSSYDTEVRVDGEEDDYGWHISIENRGVPIKSDEIDKIFDRFYRTVTAQLRVREGTGIGLFLVKKFAEIYGEVSVNSELIRGTYDYLTKFTLSIKREGQPYV
jgi:signal transduction histidine kinase